MRASMHETTAICARKRGCDAGGRGHSSKTRSPNRQCGAPPTLSVWGAWCCNAEGSPDVQCAIMSHSSIAGKSVCVFCETGSGSSGGANQHHRMRPDLRTPSAAQGCSEGGLRYSDRSLPGIFERRQTHGVGSRRLGLEEQQPSSHPPGQAHTFLAVFSTERSIADAAATKDTTLEDFINTGSLPPSGTLPTPVTDESRPLGNASSGRLQELTTIT